MTDYVSFYVHNYEFVEANGLEAFGPPHEADANQWRGMYRQGQREWLETLYILF